LTAFQAVINLAIPFRTIQTELISFLTANIAIYGQTDFKSIGFKAQGHFCGIVKIMVAIGFVPSLAITVYFLLNFVYAAYIEDGILVLFTFLESIFNVCAGCYLYNWLLAPIVIKE